MRKLLPYLKYVLILFILAFPLFTHLDRMPLRIWDEARIAVSAYEMYANGNWLIPFYDGEPDMWSTKPPMLIWLQAICMHIIGPGELATRLPVALSALLICVALILYSKRTLGNSNLGILASLVLVSSYGFVHIHMSRTGDYDVLLTFFTTLSCLSIYLYTIKEDQKYLYLFFLMLAFAVLTKSIGALFFGPAIFFYLLYKRKVLALLKNKHFYFGLLGFLFLSLGYYLLREYYNPSYISAVWENELGGRFSKALESHVQDSFYYIKELYNSQFSYWVYFLPVSLLLIPLIKNEKVRSIGVFSLFMAIGFLLVISAAKTKIFWYDAQVFPFLAICVAIVLYSGVELLKTRITKYAFLLVLPVFFYPYYKVIDKTLVPKESDYNEDEDSYEIGYVFQEAVRNEIDLSEQTYVYYDYNAHLLFYQYILGEQGRAIQAKAPELLNINDQVFAYQPAVKHYIKMYYDVELLEKRGDVEFYRILNKK